MTGMSQKKTFWERNCGAIYSVLSSLILASTGVFVKKISSVSKTELAAFRVGGQYLFLLPYVLINYPEQVLPFHNWRIFRLLLGRGFFGITAMICFYNSFEYLPIGETSTLMFCSAVVLTLCCWLFLDEKVDVISWLMLSISVIGCILVARPTVVLNYVIKRLTEDTSTGNLTLQTNTTLIDYDELETEKLIIGVSYGLAACILAGITFTFVKAIGKDIHFTVTTYYYTLVGAVFLWPIVYFTGDFKIPKKTPDIYLLCTLPITGFIAQGLRTLALQNETAFLVSVYSSTQLLFAFSFDYMFYQLKPNPWSSTGACLILTSVLSAGYRNSRVAKRKQQLLDMQETVDRK